MFTIVGERINMTRKPVREKVWERDAEYVSREARKQTQKGATHIDVNAGGNPAKEVADMIWLTQTVAAATNLPLSFDSANPEALRAGLEICNRPGTIINSITGEAHRIEGILPLVRQYNTGIVALTMDDNGMPEDYHGRMRITHKLVATVRKAGIDTRRMYLDHLVRPAATNPGDVRHVLRAITTSKQEYPAIHIALGMSNVSFGLPARNNLNRAFLAMLLAAGCDGAIMDPCEPGIMTMLLSARVTLGLDQFGMEYITAYREDRLS